MSIIRSLRKFGLVLGFFITGLSGCALPDLPRHDKVIIERWADLQADDEQLREILGVFNQAEQALQARDLESLMALYSDGYAYHGVTKESLRHIWLGLLVRYDRISSTHIFSGVKVAGSADQLTGEVVCTGRLAAMSETGARINIDSWFYEVHHLVYEKGAWRIRGNSGEPRSYLHSLGVWPHPLF